MAMGGEENAIAQTSKVPKQVWTWRSQTTAMSNKSEHADAFLGPIGAFGNNGASWPSSPKHVSEFS
eukprot:5659949-Lingulodinium_polyedra.AAC.1